MATGDVGLIRAGIPSKVIHLIWKASRINGSLLCLEAIVREGWIDCLETMFTLRSSKRSHTLTVCSRLAHVIKLLFLQGRARRSSHFGNH